MGLKSRKKRQGKPQFGNQKKKQQQSDFGVRKNWVNDDRQTKRQNARFAEYYQTQQVVPENEWDMMYAAFKEHLPSSFRIHLGGAFGEQVKDRFKTHFQTDKVPHKVEDKNGNEIVVKHPPRPIEWYPNENGWKLGLSTIQLRKLRLPEYQELHRYLVRENTAGTINRQEEVSMIPPFFLDVKPHHIVLDMCAAPGSKTQQLIEHLHKDDIHGTSPSGAVVANDADSRRAYMLVAQCKRLNTSSLTVTNHPAQYFPDIAQYDYNKEHLKGTDRDTVEGTFDRILADVPCSGDGTLRKSPDVWRTWNEGGGMVLHGTQLKILKRGLKILKPGGLLVYSTCSLNPIEDEAVVAAALRACEGSVELVDVSDKYPKLKRRQGLTTWKVAIPNSPTVTPNEDATEEGDNPETLQESGNSNTEAKQNETGEPSVTRVAKSGNEPFFTYFNTLEEYQEGIKNPKVELKKKYIEPHATMFPPTPEEAEQLGLRRCMRILPHDQDTGGFFICVLRKTKPLPVKSEKAQSSEQSSGATLPVKSEKAQSSEQSSGAKDQGEPGSSVEQTKDDSKKLISKGGSVPDFVPVKKRRRGDAPPQTKYNPLHAENYEKIREYYGLNDSFPSDCLFSRSDSDTEGNVIIASRSTVETSMRANNANGLYVVSLGVSAFKRSERAKFGCQYRLTNRGIHYIVPYMTKQVVKVTLKDLETLLVYRLEFKQDTREQKAIEAANPGGPLCRLSTGAQESAAKSQEGCIALALTDEDQLVFAKTFGYNFYMPSWLGVRTINPMANVQEITVLYAQMKEAGITVGVLDGVDVNADKELAVAEMREEKQQAKEQSAA